MSHYCHIYPVDVGAIFVVDDLLWQRADEAVSFPRRFRHEIRLPVGPIRLIHVFVVAVVIVVTSVGVLHLVFGGGR